MTNAEMIKRINEGDESEEIINNLVAFKWDYDPYGIMEAFGGHIDDEGVREQVVAEVVYLLENDRKALIDELEFLGA